MKKIKVVYLNTPVTWRELIKWDENCNLGPIYHIKFISAPVDLNHNVVAFYGWSEDPEIVERFLEERNRKLFITKTMKLSNDEYETFTSDYAQFLLRLYSIPSECEQGIIDTSNLDIETIDIVTTRSESAFLTDSTDTIQFLEAFLTCSAKYSYLMFTPKFTASLGKLSYFNYAARNFTSMLQLEILNDRNIADMDKEECSRELEDEGITASDNRYSLVDGTPTCFGYITDIKVYYLRLFKFAFWYTYIDTVPDYSSIYH